MKKEKGKERRPEERRKKKEKKGGVCGSRWERERMKEASGIFFFFFLWALPIAAFFKNAAIGCHFKIYTLDLWPRFCYRYPLSDTKLQIFLDVIYSRVFSKTRL